jgi:hypothetical protein
LVAWVEHYVSAEPGRSVRDVNRMYREALQISRDGESLNTKP